jgi:hypothetical protein
LGDAMLIDLSHYMTIPEAAAHFNWTYRLDASSPEVALSTDLTQQRRLLKAEAIRPQHQGLYICSFYAGQHGAMAFFLGQKVFQVIIIAKRRLPTIRTHQSHDTIKSKQIKNKPVWHLSAQPTLIRFKDAQASGQIQTIPRINHQTKIDHLSVQLSHHHDKEQMQMPKRRKHLSFEKVSDEDEQEESGDEEEEEEEESGTTTAESQATPKLLPTRASTKVMPITPAAKDFAGMPAQSLPSTKNISPKESPISNSSSTDKSKTSKDSLTSFSAWMADYLTNIKEEVKAFQLHNGSLMDFEGTFPPADVQYINSGNEAILQCSSRMADGILDKSKVVWKRMKPSAEIFSTSSDRYEILDSGDLKIVRTLAEDSGQYACQIDGNPSSVNVALSG